MFKSFDGYHLVEAYHKMRHEQRYHSGRVLKKSLGAILVLIGVAIASSSAMILPVSTPPNALAYATNLVLNSLSFDSAL